MAGLLRNVLASAIILKLALADQYGYQFYDTFGCTCTHDQTNDDYTCTNSTYTQVFQAWESGDYQGDCVSNFNGTCSCAISNDVQENYAVKSASQVLINGTIWTDGTDSFICGVLVTSPSSDAGGNSPVDDDLYVIDIGPSGEYGGSQSASSSSESSSSGSESTDESLGENGEGNPNLNPEDPTYYPTTPEVATANDIWGDDEDGDDDDEDADDDYKLARRDTHTTTCLFLASTMLQDLAYETISTDSTGGIVQLATGLVTSDLKAQTSDAGVSTDTAIPMTSATPTTTSSNDTYQSSAVARVPTMTTSSGVGNRPGCSATCMARIVALAGAIAIAIK